MSKSKSYDGFKDALFDIGVVSLILFVIIMPLEYLLSITQNNSIIEKCDRYKNEYKIDTFTKGNYWAWDGTFNCYVRTTDGLEIKLSDFNLAQTVEVKRLQ